VEHTRSANGLFELLSCFRRSRNVKECQNRVRERKTCIRDIRFRPKPFRLIPNCAEGVGLEPTSPGGQRFSSVWFDVLTCPAYFCLMLFVRSTTRQLPDRYQPVLILPSTFVDKALTSQGGMMVRRCGSRAGTPYNCAGTNCSVSSQRFVIAGGSSCEFSSPQPADSCQAGSGMLEGIGLRTRLHGRASRRRLAQEIKCVALN
jgi:hypothetical protein